MTLSQLGVATGASGPERTQAPPTEPAARRDQRADGCVGTLNLVVVITYARLSGPGCVRLAGQVLLPLTSPNAHMKADVRSPWAAPPSASCVKNLMFLSHTAAVAWHYFITLLASMATV